MAATASPLQFATNRANAQHSTGPATPAGKQASSRNALAHGLSARHALLPGESAEVFEQHIETLLHHYQPQDAFHLNLVHELAGIKWRLNRVPTFEASLLAFEAEKLTAGETLAPGTDLLGMAYHNLTESRILKSLYTQESRLASRANKLHQQLTAAAPQPEIENLQNEANPEPSPSPQPPARAPKTGRNDYCPCQSGLKFKRCCLNKTGYPETKEPS